MKHAPPASDRLISLSETVHVAKKSRALFVEVPQAASTAMLWALLEIEGFSDSVLDTSARADLPTRWDLVHDAAVFPLRTIRKVSSSLRREALTSPDWLRIVVLRDPYERLYAAWESKILLGAPGPWNEAGAPLLTEADEGIDIGASFRDFVVDLETRPETWMGFPAFAPQAGFACIDEIDYTDLVLTTEVDSLVERLASRTGLSIAPRRNQGNLGIDVSLVINDKTAGIIEALYADDFHLLGMIPRNFGEPTGVQLDAVGLRLRNSMLARNERAMLLRRDGSAGSNPTNAPRSEPVRRRNGWRT
jgi:hypothetical protein